jgi:hypothetical protein
VSDFIDLVYSQVIADERLKHGTKLERLAALIFKYLNPEDEVI